MPINTRPDHWYQKEYIRAPERLTETIYTKHWYEFVVDFVKDKVVLDIGCGCGGGVKFLKAHAKEIYGFDVQPQVKPLVDICLPSTKFLRSKTFDVVMAIDVIAHNVDDVGFVNEMVRLAKETIILTTPNWRKFKDANTLHYREYTYTEWKELFKDFEHKHFYGCQKAIRRLPISASDHGCRFQAAVVWLNK